MKYKYKNEMVQWKILPNAIKRLKLNSVKIKKKIKIIVREEKKNIIK